MNLVSFVALALISTAAAAQPNSLNVAATFAPIKAKLAGGGIGSVLVLGDSLSVRDGSYLPPLRDLLQAQYGNAGAGYQGFSVWSGAGFNSGWLRGVIGEDTSPHHGLDGLWASFELPPALYTSAYFDASNDQADLHYVMQMNGGSATILVPGQDPVHIDTDGDDLPEVRTMTYSIGADKRVWILPGNDGPVTVLGQVNRTGQPGILIHRAANGGWGIENFQQRDFTFDHQLSLLNPDLVMLWIGQNDQDFVRETYPAELNILLNRIARRCPDAKVLLIGTYDSNSPGILPLVQGMWDVATQRDAGFINLYHAAGTYQFFTDMGYLEDGLHFSQAGGQYIANLLFDIWNTDGLSLCLADINHDRVVDLNDFFLFLNAFDTSDLAADVDNTGAVDLVDFFAFLNTFDTGC